MSVRVLVRGVGDVGSAIAHRVYRVGGDVILHDDAYPTYPRRGMSFTDALFDGIATLANVRGIRVNAIADLASAARSYNGIPISSHPFHTVIATVTPDALIDARMRKRHTPPSLVGLATLTVGVGPGFAAGVNCDRVIESRWGARLGAVLYAVAATSLTDGVREIEGHGADRVIYAPHAGTFISDRQIGAAIMRGEPIAMIDRTRLTAPLTGYLRGLTRSGDRCRSGNESHRNRSARNVRLLLRTGRAPVEDRRRRPARFGSRSSCRGTTLISRIACAAAASDGSSQTACND